jgi:hypothetical protein
MSTQNYPAAEPRVLTPAQIVVRWRELDWGDAAASDVVNEYGVPLHACNGVRKDEHYWALLRARREALAQQQHLVA